MHSAVVTKLSNTERIALVKSYDKSRKIRALAQVKDRSLGR
jgi:hypothetical protein